jgi:hypothetical protein
MFGKAKKSSSFTKQNTFLHFGQKEHPAKHIIGFGYDECEFTILPS